MNDDRTVIIDNDRSTCLCDTGCNYIAATVIAADGTEYLMLLRSSDIGRSAVYDADCVTVGHEQVGQLPLEFVKRIAISGRRGWP
jgi:hypothetical protein